MLILLGKLILFVLLLKYFFSIFKYVNLMFFVIIIVVVFFVIFFKLGMNLRKLLMSVFFICVIVVMFNNFVIKFVFIDLFKFILKVLFIL